MGNAPITDGADRGVVGSNPSDSGTLSLCYSFSFVRVHFDNVISVTLLVHTASFL